MEASDLTLTGLESVTTMGTIVDLRGNALLTELAPLANLVRLDGAGTLFVPENLTDIGGLANFEGTPRMKRIMISTLVAAGVAVNESGLHLPIPLAEILLDPDDEHHEALYSRIAPHLPRHIRRDFEQIRSAKPRERFDMVGSTINLLRSFLSSIVRAIFSQPEVLKWLSS